MPHLESHQDLRFQRPSCYSCTTGQKLAWPDYPKAIGPRFIGVALSRWNQLQRWRGSESPDRFLGCIGIKSARVGIFCIHRRKCHLAGAFAPSPGWSGRVFGLNGKTPLGLGTWLHGVDLLVVGGNSSGYRCRPPWARQQGLSGKVLHLSSEIERSAEPGLPVPSTLLVTVLRLSKPSGLLPSAGLHNKERTPLRALVSRTRRYFTADVSVFQAHLPCDPLAYIFI
jgi:hypothetical protein